MKNLPLLFLLPALVAAGSARAQQVAAPGRFVPQQAVSFGAAGSDAVAVDAQHPLPVAPTPSAVTYVDRSGSLAAANVAQPVCAASTARRGFLIQNLSAGDLWIGFGDAATVGAPSLRLAAGQLYEAPSTGIPAGAISVIGATAGQSFTAKEW